MSTGVKFGEYHSSETWGLLLEKVIIGLPTPKKVLVDIPGGDGVLDLSSSLTGKMQYNTRMMEFYFDATNCNYYDWTDLISSIAAKIHGRNLRISLDIDPSYYYEGLAELSTEKTNEIISQIVITAECQPYKMELSSSLEDWEWDFFNFETGVIREYKEVPINGTLDFMIPGTQKRTVPTIIADVVSGTMTVEFEGVSYQIKNGENRIVQMLIKEGENHLVFKGKGTISVEYRGGML